MRFGIRKEIDWEYVGALCANEDDHNQAAFFKGMVAEISKWDTRWQGEQQLAHVNHLLSDEEKDLLSMISYKEGP